MRRPLVAAWLLLPASVATGRAQYLPAPGLPLPPRAAAAPAPGCDTGLAHARHSFRCLQTDPVFAPPHRQSGAPPQPPQPASLWSIAASAAVPGAGQAMLGLDRFVPYLAVEAYAWLQYAAHSRDARRHRDGYRDLSSRVARAPYSSFRPVGNFPYYERMSHYVESGVYDQIPGGSLEPEGDTATYNGAMWLLARRTYWSNLEQPPDTSTLEWQQAIAFYANRAYTSLYRWSWRGAELEHDEYRRLIGRANDSNRKAFQDLGLVLANHLLSTIDAYITVRLRRRPADSGSPSRGESWSITGTLPLSRLRR